MTATRPGTMAADPLAPTLLARWEAIGRPLAALPRWAAALVLAVLIAAMAWSAAVTAAFDQAERDQAETGRASERAVPTSAQAPGSGDLALYARISGRVAAGENYYAAAMDEQRRDNYPTRPFVAVRLPTLAYLHAWIGVAGVGYLALGLLTACLWAFDRRFAPVLGWPERAGGLVMLALGGAAVATPVAGLIHELVAGLCLTLALLLYRPQRWWPALIAAGLALALRELAVPFVLLWLVFAVARRRWREAAGVSAVLVVFAGGLFFHYTAVEAGRLSGDPASQGWTGLAGYALPLMALSRLTALLVLPVALAAPLAIVPLVGWLALGGRAGLFAVLWFAGFFTMMALFARPENFYWAQLVLPAYAAGFGLAPRGLAELVRSAVRRASKQT